MIDTPMRMKEPSHKLICQSGISSNDKLHFVDPNKCCEHLLAELIQNGTEKQMIEAIANNIHNRTARQVRSRHFRNSATVSCGMTWHSGGETHLRDCVGDLSLSGESTINSRSGKSEFPL
jgi:hypothetical protein